MIPRRFFIIFDIFIVFLAFVFAYSITPYVQKIINEVGIWRFFIFKFISPPQKEWTGQFVPISRFAWMLLVVVPSTILFFDIFGAYKSLLDQSKKKIVAICLLTPTIGLAMTSLVLFLLKITGWSRLFIFLFAFLNSVILISYRLFLRFYYSKRQKAGYYVKNIILIGPATALEWIIRYFEAIPFNKEYRFLGYLNLPEENSLSFSNQSIPWLGTVNSLGELFIRHPIHEVFVIQPLESGNWLKKVIEECDYFLVTLRLIPEILIQNKTKDIRLIIPDNEMTIPSIIFKPPYLKTDALFLKRIIDMIISALLLIFLSPLLIIIAISIKLSTPKLKIFYPWQVIGKNGVPFTGYKFTSMIAGADKLKEKLLDQNEMKGPVFKMKEDPRITPLGRILRKYSLDELPQLWSVLKGDMSLVGPRPASGYELERYEFWQKRKLSIRPGITCLWQVRGRNRISDFNEWVKLDLEYIEKWSLWLDFKILFKTFLALVSGTGY